MRLAPAAFLFATCVAVGVTVSVAVGGAALPGAAQGVAPVAVPAGADAHQRAGGGTVLASIEPGATVTPGATSGAETLVSIEGWVDASRLGAARDSFPATVSGRITLRMRASPSVRGAVVATLQPGTGMHVVARQGTWARVRRALWVQTSTLAGHTAGGRAATSARTTPPNPASENTPAPSAVQPATQTAATGTGRSRGIVAATGASLRDLPVGSVVGGLAPGSSVEVVGRQSGWVRVRAEGWLPEKDILSGDSVAAPTVRAADLRADPEGMKGRVVQWEVEVMAFQTADPLRLELAPGEPYLLARGPGAENVVLYLAVPPGLVAEARAIPPLTKIAVTARVRSGRSEPAGTPILDLLTIVRR
jgi:SH3-like domain-containing protein